MKITGFSVFFGSNKQKVKADAFGNNLAFTCLNCGHAVLAIAQEHQRGSGKKHRDPCPDCGTKYYLRVSSLSEEVFVEVVT